MAIKRIDFVDNFGRFVREIKFKGRTRLYYAGADAQGFIETDDEGEYIIVGQEKRYWKGKKEPVPVNLLFLNDFNICILKPDVKSPELKNEVFSVLKNDFQLLLNQKIMITKENVFKLYPYFFTKKWEDALIGYLTSAPSDLLLISGYDIVHRLIEFRNYIRVKYYDDKKEHCVYNLMHCADNKEEAIRESLLFMDSQKLASIVGFIK